MEEARRAGRLIAAAYDAVPLESPPQPGLSPRALLGWGGVFGCAGELSDVLDLGCGAGAQLAAAAEEVAGRLVGVDRSPAQCRKAEARLAGFPGRHSIICGDALDLTAEGLGRFDLIHAVGLVYVVPPPVRAHVLDLIGDCLKPGGVAVISHYAGPLHQARAALHGRVRDRVGEGLPPPEAIARGRAVLADMMAGAPPQDRMAAQKSASLSDFLFFHEVFNPFFDVVSTGALEKALARYGLGFLGQVESSAFLAARSTERAADADSRDQAEGRYHYSLFGKGAGPPDIAASLVLWSTRLRRETGEIYRWGDSAVTARISHGSTRAFLDAIVERPRTFLEAAPAADRAVTARNLGRMWQDRLVFPLRQAAPG